MDFGKAFDKVCHSLPPLRDTGKTNTWIQSFLDDRNQAVVVEGETSNFIQVEYGVPQGLVLGPSFFLYYINDNTIQYDQKPDYLQTIQLYISQ